MPTNTLTFRRATPDDISSMSHIRLAVKENILSNPRIITPQMYLDYLDKLGRGWVCENAGHIVGFSYAAHEDSSIWALFVLPEQEGLGIGKQLLNLATDYLFGLGNDQIKLGTTPNTRADRFYAASGWERGEMKNAKEVAYVLHKPENYPI
ncbi:GNAT family N-acetyltransferase [Solimicrobium silvestre]|uniref:Acetyltransferase (GNAT) domain n=1 Tax=Solimicrobium silvestre TaxID=2099400 RepID=A0A2S9H4G3_9BURK|nr:GNAT family N-acetyltransferase [Solimicrobium silvestre]PRC94872.1 Acetyltransferase (GNAT) domain [Solimicrobium silvestre]